MCQDVLRKTLGSKYLVQNNNAHSRVLKERVGRIVFWPNFTKLKGHSDTVAFVLLLYHH